MEEMVCRPLFLFYDNSLNQSENSYDAMLCHTTSLVNSVLFGWEDEWAKEEPLKSGCG